MALTEERIKELTTYLRGTNVAKENITEEYKKNLDLATRQEVKIPVGDSDDVTVYIFTAKNREPNCALHINVHGGGFVRPHVLRDEIYSAKVADAIKGIVVDVDYKLAPEYPFPIAFDETYEVCRWVFSKAKEFDVDVKRISMGGHSAGANLTAAVTLKSNITKDFKLCLQVLDYGAFDMVTDPGEKPEADTNMIPPERARMFTEAYTYGDLEKAKNIYCSPAFATAEQVKGMPTALIISAGIDNFRFEDADYAKKLSLAGVKVITKCFLNSKHGFIVHCTEEWEEGQALVIETIKGAKLD